MSKAWLKDTLERVLASFAGAALGLLPATYLPHTHIPVGTVFAAAGFAGLASLLKCFAALRVGDPDSASLNPSLVSGDSGHSDLELVILVATAVGVLLLLLSVSFR